MGRGERIALAFLFVLVLAQRLDHWWSSSPAILHGSPTSSGFAVRAGVSRRPEAHFMMVHAGRSPPPPYLYDSIHNVRRFNPGRTIVVVTDVPVDAAAVGESLLVIASRAQFQAWAVGALGGQALVVNILIGAVPRTPEHEELDRVHPFVDDGTTFWDGFWHKTLCRLYYAYDVVAGANLEGVIHHEFDNLLFFEYDEVAKPLLERGVQLTTVPLGHNNDLANMVWIGNAAAFKDVVAFMLLPEQAHSNEMERLRRYHIKHPGRATRLPIYWGDHPLAPGSAELFPALNAIFDAAALGQWAGGVDPRHQSMVCCFVNLQGPYNFTHHQTLVWKEEAPWVGVRPYVRVNSGTSGGRAMDVRVMNLHIHSKQLRRFMYRRPGTDFTKEDGSYVPLEDITVYGLPL